MILFEIVFIFIRERILSNIQQQQKWFTYNTKSKYTRIVKKTKTFIKCDIYWTHTGYFVWWFLNQENIYIFPRMDFLDWKVRWNNMDELNTLYMMYTKSLEFSRKRFRLKSGLFSLQICLDAYCVKIMAINSYRTKWNSCVSIYNRVTAKLRMNSRKIYVLD